MKRVGIVKGLRHIIMMALLISGLIVSFAGCGGGGGSNPQPTPGTVPIDFTDDFSDESGGWAKGTYVGYSSGKYFIESNSETYLERKSVFTRWLVNNYRVAVDIENVYGDRKAMGGFFFNWNETYISGDYYIFTITPIIQRFTIARYDRNDWFGLDILHEDSSTLINTTTSNRIEVEVNNGAATFYINDPETSVWSTPVAMHPAGERVAFYLSNYYVDFSGYLYIRMNFDNFHVVGTELVK